MLYLLSSRVYKHTVLYYFIFVYGLYYVEEYIKLCVYMYMCVCMKLFIIKDNYLKLIDC